MDEVVHTGELDLLIIRAQAGDLDAFGSIVQRFQDMAVGYAYSVLGDFHLAQDAAQEAFIEAYRNIARVYSAAVFAAWLRRIIFKYCDRLTRRGDHQTVQLEQAVSIASEEKTPLEVAEAEQMKQMVLSAIRSLPQEERTVTTLFYIDGYSYKEIATFLEIPATTVDNRLRASRKRLKRGMGAMVKGELHTEQPSKDESFINKVQLFNAAEARDMDKVKELLTIDAAREALYDFLKARAEEESMTVEELVVRVIRQYKKQVEYQIKRQEDATRIFREKVKSQEKQEALRAIEGFLNEAEFSQGAILDIARLVSKAKHNVPVITHCAYLASKFGYHTGPLMDIAKLAASCDHECGELYELAELDVLKLGNSMELIQLAESAVKARSKEEKKQLKQAIEKFRATDDYGSIEEALEAQRQDRADDAQRLGCLDIQ